MSEKNELIYLFGFSSRQTTQLTQLLPIIKDQIKLGVSIIVILLHDGVIGVSEYGEIPNSLNELLDLNIKVCALSPDIIARGLDPSNIDKRVQCIEYNELVDHLVKIPKIVSWM
ncbi:MAG: DsrH/TusB family sulfur metabolism protein [Candidatus Lokiarchaeota archaeon]|jgi:sulfur relay protein TusB/DsrH